MLRTTPKPSEVSSQPIGQSTALTILIMLVGICAFLWFTGRLRSRALILALLMVIGAMAYLAFWTNPITMP